MMKRRKFITLLGGAAAWPLTARAQQGERVRRIGALIGTAEGDTQRQVWLAEFRHTLLGAGWTEGRSLQIDWRWAAANRGRAAALAEELIILKPDVLFGDNTFVVQALQSRTRVLSIVFAHVTNPVLSGFVTSLAHPGGNTTGFTDSETDSRAKLVELIKQMAPRVTRIATVGWQVQSAIGQRVNEAVDRAVSSLGLMNTQIDVNNASDIERGVTDFAAETNGALLLPGDPVTTTNLKLILALAERYRLPVVGGYRDLAAEGGLASYGADINEQYRGAARYIDRILKGEKPSDLPVQQPTKYELKLNLRTARALGLDIPPGLQQIADEVIE